MNDLISVIIPAYKVEKYIDTCMHSVLNQTYKNLEIILVDDGSPDNCPKIIDEYAKKDKRIKVIHKENGGISSARNAGMDIAQGKYITFLDSDDSISLDMYETLYNLIKKYDTDIAMCQLIKVTMDEKGNIIIPKEIDEEIVEKVYEPVDVLKSTLIDDNVGNYVCTKLIKREMINNIRFPNGKVYEDAATTYKFIDAVNKIAYINKKMYYYLYGREGSITGTFTEKKICDSMDAYYGKYKFLIENYPEIEKDACVNWVRLYTSAMEKINMNNYETLWNSQEVLNKYESFKEAFDKVDEAFLKKYLEPYRLISAILLRHGRETYKEMFPIIYNNIKNKIS